MLKSYLKVKKLMTQEELKKFVKTYIELFYKKSPINLDKSAYDIKHDIEKFIDTHLPEHVYVSEKVVQESFFESAYDMGENYLKAKAIYPSKKKLMKKLQLTIPTSEDNFLHYYDLKSLLVEGLTQSYSSALHLNHPAFPKFYTLRYKGLRFIKEGKTGFIAYKIGDGTIYLDSIYTRVKRQGIGEKLLIKLIEKIQKKKPGYPIEVDAYTQDSKAFFKKMERKYACIHKSRHLNKDNLYLIETT